MANRRAILGVGCGGEQPRIRLPTGSDPAEGSLEWLSGWETQVSRSGPVVSLSVSAFTPPLGRPNASVAQTRNAIAATQSNLKRRPTTFQSRSAIKQTDAGARPPCPTLGFWAPAFSLLRGTTAAESIV